MGIDIKMAPSEQKRDSRICFISKTKYKDRTVPPNYQYEKQVSSNHILSDGSEGKSLSDMMSLTYETFIYPFKLKKNNSSRGNDTDMMTHRWYMTARHGKIQRSDIPCVHHVIKLFQQYVSITPPAILDKEGLIGRYLDYIDGGRYASICYKMTDQCTQLCLDLDFIDVDEDERNTIIREVIDEIFNLLVFDLHLMQRTSNGGSIAEG